MLDFMSNELFNYIFDSLFFSKNMNKNKTRPKYEFNVSRKIRFCFSRFAVAV